MRMLPLLVLLACGARQAPAPASTPTPAATPAAPAPTPANGLADGAECTTADQCASGVCEGMGCEDSTPGTCMPVHRGCTKDLVAFCTCAGETIRTSSRCPGTRVAQRGACGEEAAQ